MVKKLQEKCGVVALYSPYLVKQLPMALHAAGGIQHRGQQGAGLAIQTKKGIIKQTGSGLLQEIFTPKKTHQLNYPNQWVMIHCRYGTFGGYQKKNLQPCIATALNGDKIALIHNGEFSATDNLRKQTNKTFSNQISDTYLFTQLLAQNKEKTWEEQIPLVLSQVRGAYSLIIGINNSLYIARDPFGIRPMVIGKINKKWIVSSETHSLDKVGAKIIRQIKPGEISRINSQGLQIIKKGSIKSVHFCDFEWAYFSRPDSLLPTYNQKNIDQKPNQWISVTSFREKCGAILAKETPIKKADFVVGVPDSGISMATEYANRLKVPYRQVIVRDHFDKNGNQRLFLRDDQKHRIKKKVLGKLSLVPEKRIWHKAIVVVGDDSIVRGNVSQQITKAILSLGAKEVHWIIGFPPVMHRCHLGVSIRTGEELIATRHNKNCKKIAKELGATSISYISEKGFIKARQTSKEMFSPFNKKDLFLRNYGCGGCITGLYPIERNGSLYQHKTNKKTLKTALLISGSGTTAQAIIKACKTKKLQGINPIVVISSQKNATGIKKIQKLGIQTTIINPKEYSSSTAFGEKLLKIFQDLKIDLISQNGWIPHTPTNVIKAYKGKIINQHPGPLDPGKKHDFGGKGMYGSRVTATRLAYEWMTNEKSPWTESSIHFVDKEYDQGDLIKTNRLKITKTNSFNSIKELENNSQLLIKTTYEIQKQLLPLEHLTVISALQKFTRQKKVKGYNRKKPLIPQKNYKILKKVKKLAIKLFPYG